MVLAVAVAVALLVALALVLVAELQRPEVPPSRASYSSWERKGNLGVGFLMVIMASIIACGRVRTTTTTTKLPNMAAIPQETDIQPWFTMYFFDIGLSCSDQNKVSADQYHVTILRAQVYSSLRSHVFVKLAADQVLVLRLDRGLMSG